MSVHAQSALIAAILLLAMGINVAFQEKRVAHRLTFLFWIAGFFSLNAAIFAFSLSGGALTLRALLFAGLLVALSTVYFFERYLQKPAGVWRTLSTSTSIVVGLLILTRLGETLFMAGLVALFAVGSYGYGVFSLYQRMREASLVEAARLRYVVLFGVSSILTSGLDLIALFGVGVPSLGYLVNTIYVFVWMQIIQKSRLLDLKDLLGRGLGLLIQSVLISLVFSALVRWGVGPEGTSFFSTVLASVVIIVTFDPGKRLIELWMGRLFFVETFELDLQMSLLKREISSLIDVAALSERLLERLRASKRVTHASVFLMEKAGRGYACQREIGPLQERRVDMIQRRHLLEALRGGETLTRAQVTHEVAKDMEARQRQLELQEALDALSADLIFPFLSSGRLLGFLCVQDDRVREPFSSHEISLIAEVTARVVNALENSALFERLTEKDRLSAIGEMAAGMAHEIRNPLGAIKAAVQLLELDEEDEEQQELVSVILEETNRLSLVLSQFLDYARPFKGNMAATSIGRVLERVATLVRTEDWPGPIEVRVELGPKLPKVYADGDLLQQICLNLARNACEAMEAGGTLTLKAVASREGHPGRPGESLPRVQVAVSDTGPGMTEEVRKNLFIPFFTTKRKGTGLGLAISQRLLAHHQSAIRVDSTVGMGTTMRFTLPLAAPLGDGGAPR
ncbi:hypothetical protein KKF91_04110 [Myxococcota bacterium]|nr:hypothetical protein [Myxococcota bacterium]MBU1429729.1 hypothetical protein [Myxococcota bacterium]MBU1897394.1 hypothetical protein [Myxococcota bacterium]